MTVYSIVSGNQTIYNGLSTDTKPTNSIMPGSLFVETDTANQFIYSATAGWVAYFTKTGVLDGSGNAISSSGGALYTAAFIWQPSSLSYIHASADASGNLNVTAAGASATVNVSQFGGSNVVTGTGASGAGIPRVTVANDSSVIVSQATAANLNATVTGTVTANAGTGSFTVAQATASNLNATVTGTISTKTALTANSPTFATVGVTSAQALASNSSRKGLILTNTSTGNISLGFGATAVLNSGITLYPGGTFNLDEYSFTTAAVNAIAANASSNLAIQEWQ
jgi:hypothetical protein